MDTEISAGKRTFSFKAACLLAASLTLCGNAAAEVYRWVDENGEIHYSETLPPNFEDKRHDILDERGITLEESLSLKPEAPKPKQEPVVEEGELPRDASGMKRPKPLYTPQELQNRLDRLLLLRYRSEQEILDAMELEINQLAYDRRLLLQSRASLTSSYHGQIREAGDRQRAGVEVSEELVATIADLQVRLERNARSIRGLEKREASIRELFHADLERYRALVAEYAEENS